MKLTNEDIISFIYFYEEKDDVTRWCDWESKKHLFKKEFPHVFSQMEAHENSKKVLDVLVRSMEVDV